MTKNLKSLMDDAAAAGFSVTRSADGHTEIVKRIGRWKKVEGLVIYADGTAFNAALELSIARGLRSYTAMRQVLGI